MTSIKDIRNWTAEDRNEIRLMIRKLNGVIDSLNYKFWRSKDIAYMERRLVYLTNFKKEVQEKTNDLYKKAEKHLLEIKRLETKYHQPAREIKKSIKLSEQMIPYPNLGELLTRYNPFKIKLFYKKIEHKIICHRNEISYIQEEINKNNELIKQINHQIKTDCANIETERTKRKDIRDAYKKQLIGEYNNLVTRLNNMAGYQGNPIVRIEPPTTFYELPRAQYWMFHVTEQMEEVLNEQ